MPSFHEAAQQMFDFLESQGVSLPEDLREDAMDVVRKAWPQEKLYITPVDSKKSATRKKKIAEAVKLLPISVVAERYGVTRQWVQKVKDQNL